MHERLYGKIRLYTRFFDYANFRLPLSTFLVDVLRVDGCHLVSVPIMLPYWNNHFFWVDDFACPASFPWHTPNHVTRDPDPVAADFNAQDYATLVAHPSLFWNFSEAFLCLVGLSLHYTLDEETYPRFLHKNGEGGVVERERNKDEPHLLDTIVGRTVPLLPISPDRADSELKASVERLFDEGGSGNQTKQGDFVRGWLDANIQPIVEVANTVVEDAAPVQSRRQGKRKYVVMDAGGVSRPPKKLREDHGTPSGTSVGGKSRSALQRLLAEAVKLILLPEKFVEPSSFGTGSSSVGGADPITGVFSYLTGSDFLVGAICSVINPDIDLQKVYVPQWSVMNGSRLDDGHVCREMVDEFAPLNFLRLMHAEYNVKEKRILKSMFEIQGELLKAREEEIESLKARLLLREAEAAESICLRAEASNFKTVEKSLRDETNALRGCNVILEKERNALDVKVTELETSATSKEHELMDLNALVTSVKSQNNSLADRVHELKISSCGLQEKVTEKFYPHLFTTISGRMWLLTHGMEVTVANCLNSPEYLSALGSTIGKAIEKVDYISALQQLQNVNFSLLARLKSSMNASVEIVMDILCLEGPLAEKLGLNELHPNVDQLMVPIHHSPDQVVVGATALSLTLDACSSRAQKIRENIANQIFALHDLFVPLADPFFAAVLTGTEGTSDTAVVTTNTTMVLSVTFAFSSTIAPISVDDYEVMGADDQAVVNENAASFPVLMMRN
uniref:Transposase (Putative), gypsy type n=1 Tax=Tanacetum cinerariifolium TaxID=118510 RepID=A0A699HZY3_TANCI|nr:hypothetical protein [Tanacetum cinerariifolium]